MQPQKLIISNTIVQLAMDVYSFGILATEMSRLHSAPELASRRRDSRASTMEWVAMKLIVTSCIKNDRSQRLTSAQLLCCANLKS